MAAGSRSAVDVFVYGTLTDPDRVRNVLAEEAGTLGPEATLRGLHRVDGEYPTLAPGGRTEGRILQTDRSGLDALDEYERVDAGLYVRVSIPRGDADGTVDTYVGDPDRLDAGVTWPGDGAFEDRVRRYLQKESPTVVVA